MIILQGYLLTLFEGNNTTHLNYALSITHYALFYALLMPNGIKLHIRPLLRIKHYAFLIIAHYALCINPPPTSYTLPV